jgi:hypothetical protein
MGGGTRAIGGRGGCTMGGGTCAMAGGEGGRAGTRGGGIGTFGGLRIWGPTGVAAGGAGDGLASSGWEGGGSDVD